MSTDANATPVPLSESYDLNATILIQVGSEFVEKNALEVEYGFKRLDSFRAIANSQTYNIEAVKEYLIDNYDDLGSHADEIATLLELELTREIEYTVTMSATVTVTVAPGEDADSLIIDNLYIDSHNSNICVDDYEVDSTNES